MSAALPRTQSKNLGGTATGATPVRDRHPSTSLAQTPRAAPCTPKSTGEQTSATPVINFAAIEAHKENVQPLARGRSALALSNTLSLQHKERETLLASQRERHEQLVTSQANVESDDPLEAWITYVNWCIDNYPGGQSADSGLILLLERATRAFHESEQYRHDSRYLRLWVLYARNVQWPHDVYNFLLAREIGTTLASLYEELAAAYEAQSRYDKADETYRLGISRCARPLERLRRRFTEFQSRIVAGRGAGDSSSAIPYKVALAEAMTQAKRSTLGTKAGTGPGAVSLSSNSVRGLGGAAGLGGGQSSQITSARPANNGKRLVVYKEKENDAETTGSVAGWGGELGSAASRKQEDRQEAKPWKDQKLLQKGATPKKTALQIFRDSDESDDDKARDSLMSPSKNVISTPKHPSEADRLRQDPFLNYATVTKTASLPSDSVKTVSKSKASRPKAAKDNARKLKNDSASTAATASTQRHAKSAGERLALSLDLLYPGPQNPEATSSTSPAAAGSRPSEICVEELMARRRGIPCHLGALDPWGHLDAQEGCWRPLSTAQPSHSVGPSPSKESDHDTARASNSWHSPKDGAQAKRKAEPTVTMVTKAAMAEVAEMFNESSAEEESEDETDDDDSVEEEQRAENLAESSRLTPAAQESLGITSAPKLVPTPSPAPVPATPADRVDPSGDFPGVQGPSKRLVAGAKAGVRAQRVDWIAHDQASGDDSGDEGLAGRAASQPDEEAESDSSHGTSTDEDGAAGEWREHNFHALTPITERTEFTRFTLAANRTSSHTMRGSDLSTSRNSPVYSDATPLTSAPTPTMAPGTSTHAENVGERAFLASHSHASPTRAQPPPRSPVEDPSQASSEEGSDTAHGEEDDPSGWGGRANFDLSEGLTIARAEGDWTGRLTRGHIGDSFTIEERERARMLGNPAAASISSRESNGVPDHRSFVTDGMTAVPSPRSPFDRGIIADLTARLEPALIASGLIVDACPNRADHLENLMRAAKSRLRRSSSSASLSLPTGSRAGGSASAQLGAIELGGHNFTFRTLLGEGGFAAVFLADDEDGAAPRAFPSAPTTAAAGADEDVDLEGDEGDADSDTEHLVAIKVESPPSSWEFLVLCQLQQRIPVQMRKSFAAPRRMFKYADESYLLMDYGSKGTLLEIVNNAGRAGVAAAVGSSYASAAGPTGAAPQGVEEVLAMFFVIEVIAAVCALHDAKIIHGDLKIDNCLVRLDERVPSNWCNAYTPGGAEGWHFAGITLIDFGRAVDLSHFPPGQKFLADWPTDGSDCFEMREGQPWTYETDYFGIASIAYCLLFGRYMETKTVEGGEGRTPRRCIDQPMKRYWQGELWDRLFDLALNPRAARSDGALPVTDELGAIRADMEKWLTENSRKAGKNLKGLIKKLQVYAEIRAR